MHTTKYYTHARTHVHTYIMHIHIYACISTSGVATYEHTRAHAWVKLMCAQVIWSTRAPPTWLWVWLLSQCLRTKIPAAILVHGQQPTCRP